MKTLEDLVLMETFSEDIDRDALSQFIRKTVTKTQGQLCHCLVSPELLVALVPEVSLDELFARLTAQENVILELLAPRRGDRRLEGPAAVTAGPTFYTVDGLLDRPVFVGAAFLPRRTVHLNFGWIRLLEPGPSAAELLRLGWTRDVAPEPCQPPILWKAPDGRTGTDFRGDNPQWPPMAVIAYHDRTKGAAT